ncbi:glycosyltransferase family 4 protein [Priestia flexa]|uniref:Glycosyltransferase n=1 Tax=Priestia flexa TaxID=86664 RepID=A0ABU4J4W7_9BACI|nr:glycosyltransferase [Priestia flexa]MDW8516029.1 glycosyltransferase [Priestia flexa]
MENNIYIYDGIYTGHHISYAKGLIENTHNTILILNKNMTDEFSDISSERLHVINCNDPSSYNNKVIGWLFNFYNLLKMKELHNNSIHFTYADNIIIFIYMFLLFYKGKKVFMTIHWANAVIPIKKASTIINKVYRSIKFNFFKKALSKTQKIFVHGGYTKELISHRYKTKKIVEIPYGIEEDNLGTKIKVLKKNNNDDQNILFFGGIRKDKGIKKLALVARENPQWKFTIAGNVGDYSIEEIQSFFNDCENVILKLGYVNEEDIPNLFLSAAALILPYEYYFSGQSGPLTLAAKYQLPVVASNVGDMGRDINLFKLGITADNNDPKLLTMALKVLIQKQGCFSENLQLYYERGKWSRVGSLLEVEYSTN